MALRSLDLMIGDWVEINDIPKQIKFIDDCINHKIIAHGFSKDGKTIAYVGKLNEEVKPIPLTPEILEKNGIKWFCTEPFERKTYCCNEPVVQCAYIPNSGWLINVGACGSIKVRFVEISKVQYVHELQHALRLCRIEKEIIL